MKLAKCFLFYFKSSSPQGNQILEFYIFKFHDAIKWPSIKQEIQSANDTWPVCIIEQKKKCYQKNLQKLKHES